MGNQIYFKIAGWVDLDMLNMLSLNRKDVQHIKIYPPCNFEVNLITHFGVISLFHQLFFLFYYFSSYISKIIGDRC